MAVSELSANGRDLVPRCTWWWPGGSGAVAVQPGQIARRWRVVLCDDHEVTEDEAFAGVVRMAAAGEYQDFRYQLLGPNPEPVRRLPDGRPGPADLHRWLREWPKSKLFERGTPE